MAEEEVKTTVATTEAPKEAPAAAKKKKGKRVVNAGQVHIQATFNNTIINTWCITIYTAFTCS